MTDVLMENFQKYGQKITVDKDEFILSPATLNRKNGPYLLVSGVVALATITKEGEERVYLYFNEKKLIGFAQILTALGQDGRDRGEGMGSVDHAEIFLIARTNCVLYQIRETDFCRLLDTDLKFNRMVLQVLNTNYVDLLDHFQQALEESAGTRFCRLLLESCVEKNGIKTLPRSMTFLEMSRYLGTHPVTVSRIVAALKKDGCITKDQGIVVIQNEERLMELIRSGEEIK